MSAVAPRLAIFLSSLNGGGAERAMVNVANELLDQGMAVDMVLSRREGPYLEDLDPRIRVVDLGGRRMAASLPALHRYVRQERPDVMMSALFHASFVLLVGKLLLRWPQRVVISVQDTASEVAHFGRNMRERQFPRLIRWLYPRADGLVAISHGVAEDVRAITGRPELPISVIHNPVVTRIFDRMKAAPPQHAWLSDGGAPVVIALGRLVPQKDVATLLRGFARLAATRDARLLIYGEGNERAELEALAVELGIADHVAMPGFVRNPYAELAHAKVLALSSRWEGFANVVAEALACGTQVVSTDCPHGPREILADGIYGRLVPIGDDGALSEALAAALDDPLPRDSLEARGREFEAARTAADYRVLLVPGEVAAP